MSNMNEMDEMGEMDEMKMNELYDRNDENDGNDTSEMYDRNERNDMADMADMADMDDMDDITNNEMDALSRIDKISDEMTSEIVGLNQRTSQLHDLWINFEDNHEVNNVYEQTRELAELFVAVTDESRAFVGSRYFAVSEVQMEILIKLYVLWALSKSEQYLQVLLEIFPRDKQDKCLRKFLYRFGADALHVFNDVKEVSNNPSAIKKRYRHIGKITKIINTLSRVFKISRIFSLAPYLNRIRWLIKRFIKKPIIRRLRRMGFSSYMAYSWFNMVDNDFWKKNEYSLSQKIWSYKHGFMPYRIPQYGITTENYNSFLSDKDYCYLHPINNSFTKWINDKVSPRYVLSPFKEHLAECYFHLLVKNHQTVVVPLVDCPEGYESSYEGILKLLRDKGDLAFKMSSGTHGVGFRKLSYRNGVYFINNQFCHERDLIRIFDNLSRFYVITEYITLHKDLKVIYPEALNTIRLLVINEDGMSPFIGNAYMRIGSSSTGVTDNVAYGGVFAKVDVETGRYYDGERLVKHIITPCPQHPDTGIEIEGILPHWSMVKEKVLAMCRYIPQLEYMGFDIAITDKGFIMLEINVHQDLHRYPNYDEKTQQYFRRKVNLKYERNKEHVKKNNKLAQMLYEYHNANIDK